ncbi:hypothetical protein OIU85_014245 [Salix viminalis]|uniref:Uncharacterized protein n=1 Tax=Salix viminalis TaxID=40686 RepID=A0A9Q0SDE3_SALVM|nr:hypothetical protein OIU85_014245 [Salix viminalis]
MAGVLFMVSFHAGFESLQLGVEDENWITIDGLAPNFMQDSVEIIPLEPKVEKVKGLFWEGGNGENGVHAAVIGYISGKELGVCRWPFVKEARVTKRPVQLLLDGVGSMLPVMPCEPGAFERKMD